MVKPPPHAYELLKLRKYMADPSQVFQKRGGGRILEKLSSEEEFLSRISILLSSKTEGIGPGPSLLLRKIFLKITLLFLVVARIYKKMATAVEEQPSSYGRGLVL